MIAFALNQEGFLELKDNDDAFSTLVTELLPVGFKGLVIGGILAALMSPMASLFNSSAMLFTVDFYKKHKPEGSEKHYVTVGKIATVVIVILGILWIPVMKGLGKVLYEYLQDVQSLLAPGIAAVFLLGILSKKTTPAAGYIGLIVGFILGMTCLTFVIFWDSLTEGNFLYNVFIAPNWLHYEIIIFGIIIATMIVVSVFTKAADPAKIGGLTVGTFSPEDKALIKSTYTNLDIINSIIIIGIIIAFYIYFW